MIERYNRMVRNPDDEEHIIRPPEGLLTMAEDLGRDPRRPKTAVARLVSELWHRQAMAMRSRLVEEQSVPLEVNERTTLLRPSHYPSNMGLGFAVHPEASLPSLYKNKVACYTSLDIPRPFDPHMHGDLTSSTPGWGFAYLGTSSWSGRYDITTRRGGGARGGFAYTTGPTAGTYPTSVLPSPTFDLGDLGYSNGGWQPEGLQYTNRPKRLRLTNLKNGVPHKVMFARSRQVMFRNVYGSIAEDYETPVSPLIVVNGTQPAKGITSVILHRVPNSPSELVFTVSSINGERAGQIKTFDAVQAYIGVEKMSNPNIVFTGFVADIKDDGDTLTYTCKDTLGYLAYETLTSEVNYPQEDASAIIRAIIGESVYAIPVNGMLNNSRLRLPTGLSLIGKTRLSAVQTILATINSGARKLYISTTAKGLPVLREIQEPNDATFALRGGEHPRTDVPLDIIPQTIVRNQGSLAKFNVAIVSNPDLAIEVTYPSVTSSDYPTRPIVRRFIEKAVTTKSQAELFAKNFLNQQSIGDESWVVKGLPMRFDIEPGDVFEFATKTAGLSGRYRVFDVKYSINTSGREVELHIGSPDTSLIEVLRFISAKE